MNLLNKTDKEILEIADPLWDELVKHSNNMDYGAFIDEIHAKFPGSDPIEVVTDITIVVGENERKIFKEWAKYSDC